MPVRIIITDDHPLIISGLSTLLKETDLVEIIGTCASGDELIALLTKGIRPDVLLVDLQMPGKMNGRLLIKTLNKSYPEIPVLVLSGQDALFNIKEIMELGSNGYLLKNNTDLEILTDAILKVYHGDLFLEPDLKNSLLRNILSGKRAKEEAAAIFTMRQIEIIRLLSEGRSSQQIAETLYLSVRTVESHRQRLMQKLNANNVTGLLKRATELGLL